MILAQKLRIPEIQFTDHMKLKRKKDPSVDDTVLLRSGNKVLMGGNMETKYGAQTEGKTIQRLSHLGIHPYTVTKPRHYCGYQDVLADRNLI